MKEYMFVQNTDYEEFERQCSGLLRSGWIAQGGISAFVTTDHEGGQVASYLQAFVK